MTDEGASNCSIGNFVIGGNDLVTNKTSEGTNDVLRQDLPTNFPKIHLGDSINDGVGLEQISTTAAEIAAKGDVTDLDLRADEITTRNGSGTRTTLTTDGNFSVFSNTQPELTIRADNIASSVTFKVSVAGGYSWQANASNITTHYLDSDLIIFPQ